MLDSGAFSFHRLAQKWVAKTGGSLSDYYRTDEFLKYRQEYADFVRSLKRTFCITLDVMYDPELSLNNYLWFCEQGIRTIPVIHVGASVEHICRILEATQKEPWICVGGAASTLNRQRSRVWVSTFFHFCCNEDGYPTRLVHMLGLSQPFNDFDAKVPFASTDSSSTMQLAIRRCVALPTRGFRDLRVISLAQLPYYLKVTGMASLVREWIQDQPLKVLKEDCVWRQYISVRTFDLLYERLVFPRRFELGRTLFSQVPRFLRQAEPAVLDKGHSFMYHNLCEPKNFLSRHFEFPNAFCGETTFYQMPRNVRHLIEEWDHALT